MVKYLLFFILLFLCWPLALLALVLYPVFWVLMLPFRVLGVTVRSLLGLLGALFSVPAGLVRRLALA